MGHYASEMPDHNDVQARKMPDTIGTQIDTMEKNLSVLSNNIDLIAQRFMPVLRMDENTTGGVAVDPRAPRPGSEIYRALAQFNDRLEDYNRTINNIMNQVQL